MMQWDEKKTSLSTAVLVSTVTLVIGVVIGANWQTMFNNFAPYLGLKVEQTYEVDWSSLDEVYDKLSNTYNGDVSTSALIEGAKKGMAEALDDPYTVYMDATESDDFYADLHGEVGAGIGVEMGLRDGYVRVLRTLPDNPARKAGMMPGDIIYKVNGEEVYQLSADQISSRVRGEAGTEVTISVVRDGEELSFTLKREEINNVSAYVEYDGATAIVTVTRFDDDTGTLVQNLAREFPSHNVDKVILDLRGNGGGYVSAAQDLLSLWLDRQTILLQKSRHFGETTMSTSSGKASLADIKTVVLVDSSTASSSEIVAGALQDYKKATIVGEATYGKGVVQNLYTLSTGTLLKVTTAEWFTPLDRSISESGITPDIEVERTFEDINAMRDPQLDKAKEL